MMRLGVRSAAGVGLGVLVLLVSGCGSGSTATSTATGSSSSQVTATASGTGGTGGSAAGSAPAGPRGGAITIGLPNAMDTWNPQEGLVITSSEVYPQVFATLLRASPDGKTLSPSLASSYKADPAGKTLTFTLNPADKFSDGSALTSADVKFSFGLWSKGELYGNYFSSVKSVSTPDPTTVVFNLSQPDETLPGILSTSNASIYKNNYGGQPAATYWKKPIGAGPFMIDSEVTGQSITLKRNPNYFRSGYPLLDGLTYKVVSDSSQQLLQFQSGALQVLNGVQIDLAAQYPAGQLVATPSWGVSALISQTAVPPMNNADFRKALSLAINHADLVTGGYAGQAIQATTLLPQNVPGVAPCACDWAKSDLEEAKKLVASSGYDGKPLTLSVASDVGPEKLAAQAVTPMLAQAGINVTVDAVPISSLVDKLGKGNFQLSMLTYNAVAPSPVDPLGFLSATGVLFSKADPAAATKGLNAVHAAATPGQVSAAVKTFEQSAFDSGAVIPLAVTNNINAVSAKVHGFEPAPNAVYIADQLSIG